MNALTVEKAMTKLPELVLDAVGHGERTILVGEEGNAMIIAQQEWENLIETLRILSDPTIVKSLEEGHKARRDGKRPIGKPVEEIFDEF